MAPRPITRRLSVREGLFTLLWLFIATVSVHDGYQAVLFREVLPNLELNPLGRLLLRLNNDHVGLFMSAKAAGTISVCAVLLKVYGINRRVALVVCTALALAQLLLLLYLETA